MPYNAPAHEPMEDHQWLRHLQEAGRVRIHSAETASSLLETSGQVWRNMSAERTTSQAFPSHTTLIFGFEILIATFAVGFFVFSWMGDFQHIFVGGGHLNPKYVALVTYLALMVCTDL